LRYVSGGMIKAMTVVPVAPVSARMNSTLGTLVAATSATSRLTTTMEFHSK
jgi:hypothetical protein